MWEIQTWKLKKIRPISGERDRFETNENPRLERKECPVITFIRRSLPLLSLSPPSSFSPRSRRHRGKGTRKVGSHKLNLPVTIHSREKSARIFVATSANLLNLRGSLSAREKFLPRIYAVSITRHRILFPLALSFRPFPRDFDSLPSPIILPFLPSSFTRN